MHICMNMHIFGEYISSIYYFRKQNKYYKNDSLLWVHLECLVMCTFPHFSTFSTERMIKKKDEETSTLVYHIFYTSA